MSEKLGVILLIILQSIPLMVKIYRDITCIFFSDPDAPLWLSITIITLTVAVIGCMMFSTNPTPGI